MTLNYYEQTKMLLKSALYVPTESVGRQNTIFVHYFRSRIPKSFKIELRSDQKSIKYEDWPSLDNLESTTLVTVLFLG